MSFNNGLQKPKSLAPLTSGVDSHARSAITPYSAAVRNFDALPADDPLCEWEWMFDLHPMTTDMGREIRRAASEEWLTRLSEAEVEIRERSEQNARIVDRTERIIAENKLRLGCVVHCGAAPDEFPMFKRILEHNVVLGQLTIREAAATAQAIGQRNGEASGGSEVLWSDGASSRFPSDGRIDADAKSERRQSSSSRSASVAVIKNSDS